MSTRVQRPRGISATETWKYKASIGFPSTKGARRVWSRQLVRESPTANYEGFAMVSRFLAGAVCATGIFVATCANA
ncbi:MAG TPA: hypothetical protein VGH39_07460, partial [Xanthobacteraceae bacterium]